ncbi:MAG: hypothetical protein ACR2P2_13490, partial [Nakamurella sp.]
IPSTLGLLRWGIAMGAGASVLTLAFTASDSVAQAIAGSDAGGPAGSLGSLGQAATRIAIGIGGRAGYLEWIVVALVCLVGMVCALVVWVVVFLTSQFIPFVLAVMLLQYAGQAGSEKARTWSSIGWGLLWTILLLRPIIALIAKMAQVRSLEEGMQGLLTVTAMLAIAALAPGLVSKWFPTAASSAMGIMQRLGGAAQDIDAGSRVARRMGAAAAGGASRVGSLGRMLTGGDSMGGLGGGPGGGNAGTVRKAPTGPSTPTSGATAGKAGDGKSAGMGAGSQSAAATGSGRSTRAGAAAQPGGGHSAGPAPSAGEGDRNWAPPTGNPVAGPAPSAETAAQQQGTSDASTTADAVGDGSISDAATTPTTPGDAETAGTGPSSAEPGQPADPHDSPTPPLVSDDAGRITQPGAIGQTAGKHNAAGSPPAQEGGGDVAQGPVPAPSPRHGHATPPLDTAGPGGSGPAPATPAPVEVGEPPISARGTAGVGAPAPVEVGEPPISGRQTAGVGAPAPVPAEDRGATASPPASGLAPGSSVPAGGSPTATRREIPAQVRPDEPPSATRGDQGTWAPRLDAEPEPPASRRRRPEHQDGRNGSPQ